MREKRKPSQTPKPVRVQERRKDRADQSQRQYTTLDEFDNDVQMFGIEFQHYRSVTPERRGCVHGIHESVPYSRGRR